MLRLFSLLGLVALAASMTGCYASPCGSDCYNCDGIPEASVPHRPFDRLRDTRKSLLCGNGCGEVYYGEWRSYPPDCCDPCDNAQQCTPPIVHRPYMLAGLLTGWYGKRHPRGFNDDCCDECFDDCCDGGCDSGCGCDGDIIEGDIIGGGVIEGGTARRSSGCSSCTANVFRDIPTRTQVTRSRVPSGSSPSRGMETRSNSRTIRR